MALLEGLGSFAGALGLGLADDSLQKGRTEWNKEQDLDKMRKAPLAQVQGLQAAGLNPMLAYGKLDFGGVAPGPLGNTGSTMSGLESASAARYAAETDRMRMPSQVENLGTSSALNLAQVDRVKQETRAVAAEAGLSENALRMSDSLISAIASKYGASVVHMSVTDEKLSKFMKETRVDPDIADAAASVAERMNAEELNKLLNAPAANMAMQLMQVLLKGALVLKGQGGSREVRSVLSGPGWSRTITDRK